MAGDMGPLVVGLGEVKAFLRIDQADDDALIAGFIRTAMALCEAFTGQWLIERSGQQRLAAKTGWQRLAAAPVTAIDGVTEPMPVPFESDIDAGGSGWVRLHAVPTGRPQAAFRAGIAADWNGIPEPLRQGIIRLTAHLYSHRDAADAGAPPTAVAALWRPWRRMRLS